MPVINREQDRLKDSTYSVPNGVSTAELTIKKSKFVANVGRANGRQSAENFIKTVSMSHSGATHNCYAFVACAPGGTEIGFGDDGEVSGTAGRPMLNLLNQSDIGEIVAVVSRYYGGVKLGTGGLMRAYTDCLRNALAELNYVKRVRVRTGRVSFTYAQENSIRILFEKTGTEITSSQRAETVCLNFETSVACVAEIEEKIASITKGKSELIWK